MVEHKPGNAYLVEINGKKEIAIFLGIDKTNFIHKCSYRFTYSHWNFNASNLNDYEIFKKLTYSEMATILYGFTS